MRTEALTGELEAARSESRALQRALEAELTQVKATAEARERELAGALESARAEAQVRVEALMRELQAARSESQALQRALQAELTQVKATAEARERELAGALESAQREAEVKIGALQAHTQSLQNEWDAAKAKIDELNQHAHHWWTMADGLNKELQTIYASRSWRITKPLKVAAHLMRRLRAGIRSIPRSIKKGTKALIRPVLARAIRFALARPALKSPVLAWLSKYLRLKTRLRNFAAARRLITVRETAIEPTTMPASLGIQTGSIQPGTLSTTSHVDLARMTARARRIYMDLNAAIEKHQKEVH